MTLPRLGLFSRFFALFGTTTILLGACLAAAYITMSEDKALQMVKERHDSLVAMLSTIQDKPLSDKDLQKYAEQVKGHILIEQDGLRQTDDDSFPEIAELLQDAQQVDALYLTKYQSRYYLLHNLSDGWVAVTSRPFNLIIYPGWAVYWPWLAALGVIFGSYLILRRWLTPVVDSVLTVTKISTGDFSQRIEHHPNNELAELTRGINNMASDIKTMFDAKNELLLAISHELRTPLARMQISLAMMDESLNTQDIRKDLIQMNTLIEQLLEGERLQIGHKALHITTTYLPALIEEVLAEDVTFNNINLVCEIPEIAINLDVGRIKFLVRNLLSNGLKHTQPGTQVNLDISVTKQRLVLAVTDNGEGIPEHALPHLFEPFYCVENATHRDTNGTGLGLYLCDTIAKAHDGKMEVTSEVNKGSCFTLHLPV